MLHFLTFSFKSSIKSGVYVDFMWSSLMSNSLENFFIWGGLFVGEKFLMEYMPSFTRSYTTQQGLIMKHPVSVVKLTLLWVLLVSLLFFL